MTSDQWLRRWFDEVWNKGEESAIDTLLASNALVHGLAKEGPTPPGRAPFKVFWERFRGAFTDIKIVVDETIAHGDRAAARFTFTGTHTGDTLGFPASGRTVTVTGMSVVHLSDDQLVEGWNEFDFASLLNQIQLDDAAHALRA